jgi:hypothetical protein
VLEEDCVLEEDDPQAARASVVRMARAIALTLVLVLVPGSCMAPPGGAERCSNTD